MTAPTPPSDDLATRSYLCIGCPLGCRLEVDESPAGDIVEVRGFTCRKGKEYAVQEHTDPRRMVTTTVAVEGARWPRLPVRTVGAVSKGRVLDVCRELEAVRLVAPVSTGDLVLADVAGTGIDVIATRDMPAASDAAVA